MRERTDILATVEFVPSFISPYDFPIPLLDMCPRASAYCFTNTHSSMFIASPFTIARKWKQTKCPSTNKWIITMWYIYTVEYYSARKKYKVMEFAGQEIEP